MNPPPLLPAPLYQGSVNSWECDDGGHLNVRFHLERMMIGLAHLGHALDMPHAFTPAASATFIPTDLHVRFLKEARPGAGLAMHGAVIELGESEGLFCFDLRHADGAPSATFTLRATHAEPRTLKTFPWSSRTRGAAKALKRALPDHAKPRSIDPTRAPAQASLARAIELGATRIGATAINPDQCDAFGRLRAEHFFGRVSDSVPNLLAHWRQSAPGAAPAGAVVEARLVFRRWPGAGDLIEIRTGVAEAGEKTLRLVHWLCDPVSGEAWASLEALALTFDTATRKALAPSPEARAAMQARVIADMAV